VTDSGDEHVTIAIGDAGEFGRLRDYLLEQTRACVRPPVDRFRHTWIAPMPLSQAAAQYLGQRGSMAPLGHAEEQSLTLCVPDSGDGFAFGDYSLGLFHHDTSEAAIELVHHEDLREAAFGSLLCFLDCASPTGAVHRIELPYKARDAESAKPVMAQLALRTVEALGPEGLARAEQHRVLDRLLAFTRHLEQTSFGLHGLFVTHSSRASGFDNDILTAELPDGSVEGPDTNAFMVLEYEALGRLAALLGRDEVGREHAERAEALRDRMNRLMWYEDDRGGMYVGLRWQHGVGSLDAEVVSLRDHDGHPRPLESWVTLLPLYAGVPSPARAELLVSRLCHPEGYWGPVGVRTAPSWDPFFSQAARVLLYDHRKHARGPVSNWMGPVWILANHYMASGLARYGHTDRARTLASRTARLLADDLERTGSLHECYDDSGRGLWPRRGTFISWNVLALTMLREHLGDPFTGGAVDRRGDASATRHRSGSRVETTSARAEDTAP
jgi:putative isomerase